ncbi:MAG TPA: hypothetical protein VHW65_08040 [Gemmatimonadales bacterium]|nr:hypothetical protein [Gemmatimonadales bacterium]
MAASRRCDWGGCQFWAGVGAAGAAPPAPGNTGAHAANTINVMGATNVPAENDG